MEFARRTAGALVLLAPFSLAARAGGGDRGDDLLHDALAQRWLERHEEAPPKDWTTLLERSFVHVALGAFDVYLPDEVRTDADSLESAGAALQALHDAQNGWTSWVAGRTPERLGKRRKEEPLARWLAALKPKSFTAGDKGVADLAQLGSTPGEVRALLARLAGEARGGPSLGLQRALPGVRLVVFPRRSEFVEFVCVVGLLDARLRACAWQEGLSSWLEFQAGDVRFLTLETGGDTGSEPGVPVQARNPLALGELVTQVSIRALLAAAYGEGFDPALASAMANTLVIDLYGELDTRIDGDVRARSTQGRSTFVPGGNPDGGVLPASSAENRWRGSKGKDHFLAVLAQVQKQGGRKAATRPERLTGFELASDDGREKVLARAPFLGAAAQKPPAAVLPDYLELLRSYGVAFLHWLRVAGGGEGSAELFGTFLRSLGQSDARSADLPRVLEEVYGRPLSAAGADELFDQPTLEGQFLAWLATQG